MNYYPQPGDTVTARCYISLLEGASTGLIVGGDSMSDGSWDNGIGIFVEEKSGTGGEYEFKLYERDGTKNKTTSIPPPLNEHVRFMVQWDTDDTFTASLLAEDGTSLATLSFISSSYNSSNYGIGFYGNDFAGNRRGTSYWDLLQVE